MSNFPFIVDATAPSNESIGFAPSEESEVSTPALRPFRPNDRVLESVLPGISHEAWTDFVFAMKVAPLSAISKSNGLGMFDLRYKRLQDLGLVTNLSYKRDPIINRSVQVADWVPPLTKEKFLKSANAQYKTFVASMKEYFEELRSGGWTGGTALPVGANGGAVMLKLPPGLTYSGALAILHRGGRSALAKWVDPEQQFEATRELVRVANGVF